MEQYFICGTEPLACKGNVVQGEGYRITAITGCLIRFEYSAENRFEDRASQIVWFRDLGPADISCERKNGRLEIRTGELLIRYDEKPFSETGLSVQIRQGALPRGQGWYYGKELRNLGGTARTLDHADGAIPLEDGVISFDGFAVLDDSHTLVLDEGGWVAPRRADGVDFYLFAYGHDYQGAVRDFYRITGRTPMLPRYALGNWWSRYYRYTEESYLQLMRRFDEEEIPFSVAVIDMDWHLVNIDPGYGSGWTGYTWNRELFPDPKRFLDRLHERGMKVTLNLHPALGVRAFEERYPQMAAAMGMDADGEEPVEFRIEDPTFLQAYFDILHHPLEEEGVDFWWIDWQQGSHTDIEGLDPLWMLNHYHYLDNGRDGKRPMCFSRYAGPGSHRYPVGFSGDTVISWESLEFQPYFTYTASNIGYGWWSHDIGGHMLGERSDVMEARWYQYGVFSPINRLHSSNFELCGKEPWKFRQEVRTVMDDFLRLRHRLLPYLYTMNYLAYRDCRPLVRPMYYEYPESPNAYPTVHFMEGGFCRQYLFGTQMMAAPIVSDLITSVNMGRVRVWIPEGVWHDFFTGLIYQGETFLDMYRGLESIPVLVPAGGIVPMTDEIFVRTLIPSEGRGCHPARAGRDRDFKNASHCAVAVGNPYSLEIRVYGGADGSFTLYEDDNETNGYQEGICATTDMSFSWESGEFILSGAEGHTELLPEKRVYTVKFMGVSRNRPRVMIAEQEIAVAMEGDTKSDIPDENTCRTARVSYEFLTGCIAVKLPAVYNNDRVRIIFDKPLMLNNNHEKDRVHAILNAAQIPYVTKENAYKACLSHEDAGAMLREMAALDLDADVYRAVLEILTARLA
ncbi:MAG: glycoside hydrolase family 31 protein [Lachnospiraceae bacterium]|nr:glycoside hydrolase family 31 protein [Lachnospiraceae bacterium]